MRLWKQVGDGQPLIRLLDKKKPIEYYNINEEDTLVMDKETGGWQIPTTLNYALMTLHDESKLEALIESITMDTRKIAENVDEDTLEYAIRRGNISIFEKMVAMGCTFKVSCLNCALMTGNPLLVDKVLDLSTKKPSWFIDMHTLNCALVGKQPIHMVEKIVAMGARADDNTNSKFIHKSDPPELVAAVSLAAHNAFSPTCTLLDLQRIFGTASCFAGLGESPFCHIQGVVYDIDAYID